MTRQSLKIDADRGDITPPPGDYGVWTDHEVPEDPADWHPLVRRFYDYWRAVAPPGPLPGREHIVPEDIAPLLSRLWILDVFRDPLRFRYRLVGTEIVRSVQRELTGQWLDEAQPLAVQDVDVRDRYRFVVDTGQAAWRRGPTMWTHDPNRRVVENCLAPLATDGVTVDMIVAVSV